jgi:hypothetical protein
MKRTNRVIATACGLLAASAMIDVFCNSGIVIQEAAAVIGRPATPVSGAGVARRTSRRVIRRSTIYAATLPVGYTTVVVEGTTLYYYGGTYYQPYNNQYVVVYVD